MELKLSPKYRLLLGCIAGGLVPLSLSPVDIWPLTLASIFALFALLQGITPRQAAQLGWAYGLGFFGLGVSWIYVSISVYGNAPIPIAALITAVFVAVLALLFCLQCWLYQHFFNKTYQALSFAAVWVLFEWLRAWFLTGFPWLYLGYAHINSPLAGIAPVFGVMGISFILVLSAGYLFQHYQSYKSTGKLIKTKIFNLSLLLPWLLSAGLTAVNWVDEVKDKNITVGLVQANIDQKLKFNNRYLQQSLDLQLELSSSLWDNDIIIWSETAVPLPYQNAERLLENYTNLARSNDSTLVTGIFSQEDDVTFNSVIALGNGEGVYHKQKMVPFGEYIPFRTILSSLFQVFDLPMSSLRPGESNQTKLSAKDLSLATFICFEVVYPDFVRQQAIDADFLITISNDTWFGDSLNPAQHLQMAAMRALENGRYMARASNNGISAIINEKGKIVSRTPQFEAAVLAGEVKVFEGRTPFSLWGSYPVIFFSAFLLFLNFLKSSKPLES